VTEGSFDRSYMTSYHPAMLTIALSCVIFKICDAEGYRDLEGLR